jgi:hypothetical protein
MKVAIQRGIQGKGKPAKEGDRIVDNLKIFSFEET